MEIKKHFLVCYNLYMNTITRKCLFCQEQFEAKISEIKRGYARYCSSTCFHVRARKQKTPNCACLFCDKQFYRSPSKIRKNMFCSRSCKDAAQEIGISGLNSFKPSRYVDGINSYRRKAFKYLQHKCNECNYNKIIDILVVHHKDHDRTNNCISNLEILCPTCHEERHFKTKTGKWSARDLNSSEYPTCKTGDHP